MGAAVRELTGAITNPLAQFFAQLASYGFQIMLWEGVAMLTGTICILASAADIPIGRVYDPDGAVDCQRTVRNRDT